MLLIKYWKQVFNKDNKTFLTTISICVELIVILIAIVFVIAISTITNNFKLSFWNNKIKYVLIGVILFLQTFFYFFVWYVLIKKKYLKQIRAEDRISDKSVLNKERFTEWIIDDRKILSKSNNAFEIKPVSSQEKSSLLELEKYYPKTEKSEEIGLLIRNVYNKKAKKLEQNITIKEHCAIFGTTGSGKSVLLVKPTVLYFIEQIKKGKKISSFIFDPKGDLYTLVYKELENAGIKSYMLDLDNPLNSCGYNFLSVIWDEYHEAFDYLKKDLYCKVIKTDATLQSYTHSSSKCFKHNSRPCQECYETLKNELIENEHVNLYFNTIRENVPFSNLKYFTSEEEVKNFKEFQYSYLMGNATNDLEQLFMEFVPDHMDSSSGTYFTASPRKWLVTFSLLLLELNIASGGNVVSKEEFNLATIAWILSNPKEAIEWLGEYKLLDGSENSKAVGVIEILNKIPDDNQGSFLIEISNRLNIFNNELIKKITSPMEVDIEKMFKEPTLFFVKLEPNKISTMGVLITILCNQIYNEQTKYIERKRMADPKDEKLDVTWINMIDEFSNLPPIFELESKLSFCRSRDIFWYMFIQEKEQVKSRYNESTQKIILSQARTTIYLMGDLEAKEYVVKNAGKRKVIKNNIDFESNKKSGVSETIEDLITEDELKKKPFPTIVVLNQNKPPLISYMTPIYEYEKLKNKEGEPMLSTMVPLIPVSKIFEFNWNTQGKFNLYDYDSQRFNLDLINPEFYKNKEDYELANDLMMSFKTIVDPLDAFALNGEEILSKNGTEILGSLTELIEKYISEESEEKKDEIFEEINQNLDNLNIVMGKLNKLKETRKKRELNNLEKKEYLECQKLIFKLGTNN